MKKLYFSILMSCFLYVSSFAQTLIPEVGGELILPQYAYYGAASNARLHYACRLTLTGLTASTLYRYTTGISSSATTPQNATPADTFVPGHFYTVSSTALIGYATRQGLNGANIGTNSFLTGGTNNTNYYSQFTTDASGNYTGWFMAIPTGSTTHHGTGTSEGYFYVQVASATSPGPPAVFPFLPALSFRTTNKIKLLNYTTDAAGVTALVGDSNVGAEKFVSLYDNDGATGRPLYTTFTEDDGINISTATTGTSNYVTTGLAWTTWYNLVDANTNGWGAIIPNTLQNGVRVIRYTNIDGTSAGADRTSANGVFGAVSTVNPSGGTTAINLDPTTLPISLTSFTGLANTNSVRLNWSTASEISNQYFEILRAGEDKNFVSVGRVNGAGNSSSSKSYSFDDNNPTTGNNYYQLKQYDVDGKSTSFGPVAVKFGLSEDSFSILSTSESSVSVSISSAAAKEGVISYLGIDGRLLYKQQVSLNNGLNTFNIPVDKSTGRIGVISFTSGGEQKSLKVSR
jgi:hypothetical protein